MMSVLAAWRPRVLSLLRFFAGLLLVQHGTVKLLAFPSAFPRPIEQFSQLWYAGAIELVGGVLIAIGLFTRPAAFIASGMCAVAYWQAHAPRSFYPINNGGELAALYSFVFLYLVFAGGGSIGLDARRRA